MPLSTNFYHRGGDEGATESGGRPDSSLGDFLGVGLCWMQKTCSERTRNRSLKTGHWSL